MNATFRQIRLFQALADTGSVSAAARAMHVTQPTASMQLKEVSQAIGLPLYEVIGKKVHLTEVGQELAATARSISAAPPREISPRKAPSIGEWSGKVWAE
jgi:DNA-binding transcriptional LysR family regulator